MKVVRIGCCYFVLVAALAGATYTSNAVAQTLQPDLRADAVKLDQPSNAERLKALTALLRERELKFEALPFPNPRQDRDAREQGQNFAVTLGAGARTIIIGAPFDAARLPDGQSSFSASPVAGDGKLYLPSEDGDLFVVKAGPQFELLAKNVMGEPLMAPPAISDGLLMVRTQHQVVAIQTKRHAGQRR